MGKDGWPSVGSEEQRWEPTAGRQDCRFEIMAKRKCWSAVPPKIAGLTPNLDSETASLAERAVGELQRFDSELGDRVATFGPVLRWRRRHVSDCTRPVAAPIAGRGAHLANLSFVLGRKRALSSSGCLSLGPSAPRLPPRSR